MGKRHKSTIACDISPKVRRAVWERDEGRCIVCGTTADIQIAHYISRARMGMGVETNLACMCIKCHAGFDQGIHHGVIGSIFKHYLEEVYGEEWCAEDQYYRKGREP